MRDKLLNFLLCGFAAILFWQTIPNLHQAATAIPQMANIIVNTPPEILKENKYEYFGYKYIRDVTENIPDPNLMPVTRYYDHTKLAHLYLPKFRNRIEDKLIIGIGINNNDLSEQIIAPANFLKSKRGKYFYTFQTIHDYYSLTAIEFKFDTNITVDDLEIKTAIYSKYPKNETKSIWNIKIPKNQSDYTYRLPNSLKDFSFGRGRTDFHIVLNSNQQIQIKELIIYGVKIDLQNYTIINRQNSNFLAIDNDFYKLIINNKDIKWLNYINGVKNVN
jgi:hypothetical protein